MISIGGAAELHCQLASEDGDQIRLHQNGPRGEIGHVGSDIAGILPYLQERIHKLQILSRSN